jgi:uncharacterized membrane protein
MSSFTHGMVEKIAFSVNPRVVAPIIGGLGGAGIGALAGGEDNRLAGALTGGILGSALGFGVGYSVPRTIKAAPTSVAPTQADMNRVLYEFHKKMYKKDPIAHSDLLQHIEMYEMGLNSASTSDIAKYLASKA